MVTDGGRCEHGNVTEELRSFVDAMAARAEPVLARVAAGRDDAAPAGCTWCPVCAAAALLRGERPELAVRAAEHTAGLLAVLRAALAEQSARPAGPAPDAARDAWPDAWPAEPEPARPEPPHTDSAHTGSPQPDPPVQRASRVQRIELRRPGQEPGS